MDGQGRGRLPNYTVGDLVWVMFEDGEPAVPGHRRGVGQPVVRDARPAAGEGGGGAGRFGGFIRFQRL